MYVLLAPCLFDYASDIVPKKCSWLPPVLIEPWSEFLPELAKVFLEDPNVLDPQEIIGWRAMILPELKIGTAHCAIRATEDFLELFSGKIPPSVSAHKT